MAGISQAAAAAREQARRADGQFGEQVHADPGDDIIVTEVPVMYRDASNYKAHGAVLFPGHLTDEQKARLKATLDSGEWFIPAQIGLRHLGPGLSGFPNDDDHPFHEIDLDQVVEKRRDLPYPSNPDQQAPMDVGDDEFLYPSAEAFVQAMEKAAAEGWDPVTYNPVDDAWE